MDPDPVIRYLGCAILCAVEKDKATTLKVLEEAKLREADAKVIRYDYIDVDEEEKSGTLTFRKPKDYKSLYHLQLCSESQWNPHRQNLLSSTKT